MGLFDFFKKHRNAEADYEVETISVTELESGLLERRLLAEKVQRGENVNAEELKMIFKTTMKGDIGSRFPDLKKSVYFLLDNLNEEKKEKFVTLMNDSFTFKPYQEGIGFYVNGEDISAEYVVGLAQKQKNAIAQSHIDKFEGIEQ